MKSSSRVIKKNSIRKKSKWKSILVYGENGKLREKYELDELGNHIRKFKKMTPRKMKPIYSTFFKQKQQIKQKKVNTNFENKVDKVSYNENGIFNKVYDYELLNKNEDVPINNNEFYSDNLTLNKKDEKIPKTIDVILHPPVDNVNYKKEQNETQNISHNTIFNENFDSFSLFDNQSDKNSDDYFYMNENFFFL